MRTADQYVDRPLRPHAGGGSYSPSTIPSYLSGAGRRSRQPAGQSVCRTVGCRRESLIPGPDRYAGAVPRTSNSSDDRLPAPDDGEPTSLRRSFAARLLQGGAEPDPRFTLANERTFLAWIRTALALLAGGIAVEAFTSDIFIPQVRKLVAILLLMLAMIVGIVAAIRWLRVERAMRHKTPLPLTLLVPVLALGGAVVAGILVVFVVLRPS